MNESDIQSASLSDSKTMPRAKAWGVLVTTLFMLYIFAVAIGPWLQHHIYGMEGIVQVIEEQNIDAGAYFYTGIEGSYDGEKYLSQALVMAAPEHFGLTIPFMSGIFICFLLLAIGWRYLPR